MRFRTLLPAATLVAAVAFTATACDAGIEDKDKASSTTPGPTSAQPTTTGSATPQGTPSTTPTAAGASTSAPAPTAPKQPTITTPTTKPGGSGPIVISASIAETTVDCTGRDVRLEASDLTLAFTGTCGTLILSGDDNSLETGWFDRINVTGSNNLVLYGLKPDGTAPTIDNTGTSNRILKK